MTARSDGVIAWGWWHRNRERYIAAKQAPGKIEVVLVTRLRWEALLALEMGRAA